METFLRHSVDVCVCVCISLVCTSVHDNCCCHDRHYVKQRCSLNLASMKKKLSLNQERQTLGLSLMIFKVFHISSVI